MLPSIARHVKPHTEIPTDEWHSYSDVGGVNGYLHKRVNHSAGQYVCRNGGTTVNGLEGFWAALTRGINGTHLWVSWKHLAKYLGEFEFPHNRRHRPKSLLSELMLAF